MENQQVLCSYEMSNLILELLALRAFSNFAVLTSRKKPENKL